MNEEAEVIRRVVDGDVDSFRFLVDRYQRPVLRLVRNLVADPHLAEDIVQDTFLAAFRRLRGFDPARARFLTWLMTIARNRCLNVLQKKRPVSGGSLPEAVCRRTPQDALVEKELFEQLDAALEALPLGQRATFVMAEFVGLSYEEIAGIEGVETSTVRSRVSRARERLRSLVVQFARENR